MPKAILFLVAFTLQIALSVPLTPVAMAEESGPAARGLTAQQQYQKGRESYLYLTPMSLLSAIRHYHKAIEADKNFVPAYAGLSEAYSYLGYLLMNEKEDYEILFTSAYENILIALKLDGSSLETQRALALVYLFLNRKNDTRMAAIRALNIDPNDAESMCLLWEASGAKPDDPLIHKAIKINKKLVFAHLRLGRAYYYKQDRYSKSAEHIRKALEISPQMDYAHAFLGKVFRSQGYMSKAVSSYLKAIDLNPTYSSAYMDLGITFFYMGKMEECIHYQQKAISLNSRFPDTYYYLARAQEKTNQDLKAKRNFEKFLDLSAHRDRYASHIARAKESLHRLNEGYANQ